LEDRGIGPFNLQAVASEPGTLRFAGVFWRRDDPQRRLLLLRTQMLKGIVMKRQNSTPGKTARKLSDAILATRYLDLQRLRDEVRKAEARFAPPSLKKG
jgi:hypothetical protein